MSLNIALVTVDYPPMGSSVAVQMRDLANELAAQGHKPIVFVPDSSVRGAWASEQADGIQVVRVAASRPRDTGYFRRAVGEGLMPWSMLRRIRRSPLWAARIDAIAWYSPSIFLGLLVLCLKLRWGCRAYLILRDIFPEWALDLGLLRPGAVYGFFKAVAWVQYAVADCIGVQTESDRPFVAGWEVPAKRRVEVLHNWLAPASDVGSSIVVEGTKLARRSIFAYTGNMGVAQGVGIFLDVAESLKHRDDLGFLFVGRGMDLRTLRARVAEQSLDNVIIEDEIDPREIPGLLRQCHVGMLAIDPRFKTHNIPGKFLSYLRAGLPVLARVNPETDLVHLIERERVGHAYVGDDVEQLGLLAQDLLDNREEYKRMSARGRALARRMFSPATAARQIVAALDPQ